MRNVHGLNLGIRCSNGVGELKNFFDDGKDALDWALRMVRRLLDNVLSLAKFVGHQLTVYFLEVSEHVRHGVVDVVSRVISDIRNIRFLNRGNDLLQETLLYSRNFSKQMHFLSVRNLYVRIHVGGCSVWDDEWTRVSWINEGSG